MTLCSIFMGIHKKKDGNTRAIFAPSAPSFPPYLFVMRQLLIIKRNMVFWRRILFQVTPIKTACLRWGDVFHSAMDSLCNKGHTEKEHDKKCRRFYSIYVFFSFCAFQMWIFINQESQRSFRFASNMVYWLHQLLQIVAAAPYLYSNCQIFPFFHLS